MILPYSALLSHVVLDIMKSFAWVFGWNPPVGGPVSLAVLRA